MMMKFKIGQRWISESEPELGLGIVESIEKHQLRLIFKAAGEVRLYAPANAPIKRVEFCIGDTIYSEEGSAIVIESVNEHDGLFTYIGEGVEISESELTDTTSFSKPEERLIGGQVDLSAVFALRYEALANQYAIRKSEIAGFAGGRIDLIPHQLYIASEVASRYLPRVLLADEVGLGKTIEACLILHRLHLTGRAERVLIIVPESLVHQWFVELLRRFNLWFSLFDGGQHQATVEGDSEINPFLDDQLVICSISTLLSNQHLARYAAEASWDLLIVDEAHHLEWTPQSASPGYQLVEALASRSQGVLLLTATPDQLGVEGHFARLRLLDAERYHDLEKFKAEQANYIKVAAVAEKLLNGHKFSKKESAFLRTAFNEYSEAEFAVHLADRNQLVKELVDRHGTGRVIFRNTRSCLSGFPERKAMPQPLAPRKTLSEAELHVRLLREFDMETGSPKSLNVTEPLDYRHGPRIRWLAELLRDLRDEKVLLICRTKEKVQAIFAALSEEMNVKAAVFHEDLSLLQRDRNAAWFAEADGARILLCSEIGSEGRNFQFAHHLVLFDLPLNPELLEQRIGRLDRIGQTKTIQIHMPYLKQSWIELLMRWHHEGIEGVENSLRGGYAYLEKFKSTLCRLGKIYHEGTPTILQEADKLIQESYNFSRELETKLSKGQNRLIGLNSFNKKVASHLVKRIREQDANRELDQFMNRVFDHFGVIVEDIDECTYYLSADQLFVESFPGLPQEGMLATWKRKRALSREDIGFLTLDHPMVRGAIDLILGNEKGNSAIVVWRTHTVDAPPVLIEAIFVLESIAPAYLHIDRFLPPTPLRVVVDTTGQDYSDKYGHVMINRDAYDEEAFRLRQNPELLRSLVPEMLKSALDHASRQKSDLLEAAIKEAHDRLDSEASRLKKLSQVNPNVRLQEIEIAENIVADVVRNIGKAHLRLDSIRLILRTS